MGDQLQGEGQIQMMCLGTESVQLLTEEIDLLDEYSLRSYLILAFYMLFIQELLGIELPSFLCAQNIFLFPRWW